MLILFQVRFLPKRGCLIGFFFPEINVNSFLLKSKRFLNFESIFFYKQTRQIVVGVTHYR